MNFIKKIKQSINFELDLIEKRPNIYQVVAPYYYEDGDMIEFYISLAENEKTLIFSDFADTNHGKRSVHDLLSFLWFIFSALNRK